MTRQKVTFWGWLEKKVTFEGDSKKRYYRISLGWLSISLARLLTLSQPFDGVCALYVGFFLSTYDFRSEGASIFAQKKVWLFRAVVFSNRELDVVKTIKSNRKWKLFPSWNFIKPSNYQIVRSENTQFENAIWTKKSHFFFAFFRVPTHLPTENHMKNSWKSSSSILQIARQVNSG